MSLRSFDVIVFGASGNIGSLISKYIHRNQLFPKWAILGRTHKHLSNLMNELVEMGGSIFPEILIADAQDVRNLRDIFLETQLLLNCLSPITLFRDIIEACLMARCDYVDLCSDVNFIQQCFMEFQAESLKKGVCIMHAFNFDGAIPDLGVSLARSVSGNGACQLVESFLKISAPKGYTQRPLIDSIVSHSKNKISIRSTRHKIEDKFHIPVLKHPGAKVDKKIPYYYDDRVGSFATPSLGAETFLIPFAIRGHCLRHHQTTQPQYHSYIASDNYLTINGIAMHSTMLQSMSSFSVGRSVVRSFPEVVTEGVMTRRLPTQEQLEATTFEMIFISKGFMKAVGTPYDSEVEDGGNENGAGDAHSLSDMSDVDSTSQLSRRGYIMTADTSAVDTNIGVLPCTFFTRPRSRSRYIITDATMNTSVVKWIRVSGPDPYYHTSSILACRLIQLYLLHKREQSGLINKTLPIGGVFTASGVFQNLPTVFDHLADFGLEFQISSQVQDVVEVSDSAIRKNKESSTSASAVDDSACDDNKIQKSREEVMAEAAEEAMLQDGSFVEAMTEASTRAFASPNGNSS